MADTLASWDQDAHIETAVLLTSELVTNAIVHARSEVTLIASLNAGVPRISVLDDSTTVPRPRLGGVELAAGGRGIPIVEAFAARWGTFPMGRGKLVWFELV